MQNRLLSCARSVDSALLIAFSGLLLVASGCTWHELDDTWATVDLLCDSGSPTELVDMNLTLKPLEGGGFQATAWYVEDWGAVDQVYLDFIGTMVFLNASEDESRVREYVLYPTVCYNDAILVPCQDYIFISYNHKTEVMSYYAYYYSEDTSELYTCKATLRHLNNL